MTISSIKMTKKSEAVGGLTMWIRGSEGRRSSQRGASAAVALSCLLLLTTTGAKKEADSAAIAEARAAVSATLELVLVVLSEEGLSTDERRSRIQEIAHQNFDFTTMSKGVLKRNWKQFSEAQRVEFIEEFKTHLSESYGSRLERYNQEQIKILGERPEKRGDVTVKTTVVGGQFDGVAVDYRMRKGETGWLAINVTIEGVSLISNFHSQFAEIVARDGPEGLLMQLREKNAKSVASAPTS